jgi:FMN phosphatase YigB (HAD superfamily)
VYRQAAERLAVPISRIRLVTCNALDSVGASAAGMRTAWVNRSAAPSTRSARSLPAALRQWWTCEPRQRARDRR